jgi:hypothetical protein
MKINRVFYTSSTEQSADKVGEGRSSCSTCQSAKDANYRIFFFKAERVQQHRGAGKQDPGDFK